MFNSDDEPCFSGNREVVDINRYHRDYRNNLITVDQLLAVYRSMGGEYYNVYSIFSMKGNNRHLIVYDERMNFRLYL